MTARDLFAELHRSGDAPLGEYLREAMQHLGNALVARGGDRELAAFAEFRRCSDPDCAGCAEVLRLWHRLDQHVRRARPKLFPEQDPRPPAIEFRDPGQEG